MVRRALLVAAASVALTLTPAVAMAVQYPAPGLGSSVSDSTPAIGQSVTVVVKAGKINAGQMITLVITAADGTTRTLTGIANANGVVNFTFKLSAAGTYTVKAFNAAGDLLSTQVLTAGAKSGTGNGNGNGNDNGNGNGNGDDDKLSFTGFEAMPLVVGGGVLVLAGAGAVVVARRRRSAKVPA